MKPPFQETSTMLENPKKEDLSLRFSENHKSGGFVRVLLSLDPLARRAAVTWRAGTAWPSARRPKIPARWSLCFLLERLWFGKMGGWCVAFLGWLGFCWLVCFLGVSVVFRPFGFFWCLIMCFLLLFGWFEFVGLFGV